MRKKVSALLLTFVLVAFVPTLTLSLVACEPEDNEPGTEMVETEGKGDDATGSDHPESDAEGEGSTPGADAGEEGGSPEKPAHEAVDLGLSVKWASCNVGADSPEEYGDYFAWGETTTKLSYSSDNSVTDGLSISALESRGIIDANGNLTAAYDAATANWGDEWRMPTLDEMRELIDKCTWEWTTQNGVNGRKVTGPNGNSIFLPASGGRNEESLYPAGSYGRYWSASPHSNIGYAYYLLFDDGYYDWDYDPRCFGLAVRPVSE